MIDNKTQVLPLRALVLFPLVLLTPLRFHSLRLLFLLPLLPLSFSSSSSCSALYVLVPPLIRFDPSFLLFCFSCFCWIIPLHCNTLLVISFNYFFLSAFLLFFFFSYWSLSVFSLLSPSLRSSSHRFVNCFSFLCAVFFTIFIYTVHLSWYKRLILI